MSEQFQPATAQSAALSAQPGRSSVSSSTQPSAQPAPAAFQHLQSAHCESGAVTRLLHDKGLPISEAMVFGLSSALAFCYFPFIKVNALPLISYRMSPRCIIKSMKRLLHVPMRIEKFSDPAGGMRRLDELLAQGQLVGMQTSIYFLPYFPSATRFPFNMHNLLAYGRDPATGEYLISDPIMGELSRCAPADLQRARFTRGDLAPHGRLYYLDGPIPNTDMAQVVPLLRPAIRKNARLMGWAPFPFVGTQGIRLLASRMRRLSAKNDAEYCLRLASHIVRMQEVIGTGGAGFRFLYAVFLKEASGMLNMPALNELSLELMAIGDEWRQFAVLVARQNKGRDQLTPSALADILDDLAAKESAFFKKLKKAV